MKDDIEAQLVELQKMGTVTSSTWQSYTWKNELAEQKRRIGLHLEEVLDDAETEHDPCHMLERAIGVAAVCMRRLIECRLVTDRFRGLQLTVHAIHAKTGGEWREPFPSQTANTFNNYDMKGRHPEQRTAKVIANRMLHARVIGVLSGSAYIPDGLLIASDTQSRESMFHFTPVEIASVIDAFLTDQVRIASEGYLDADGNFCGTAKVFCTRE